jgi:pimeloyl-ACP methyl ester carboxylesterase
LKADLAVEDATGTPKADSTPKATGALKADGTRLAAGQHWRAIVGAADSSCLLRLLIPTGSAEKAAEKAAEKGSEKAAEQAAERRPLVVAVHGAGGSENMFFDAYGAGKIARLCESRGWLLAAPRQGLWGGIGIQWDELVAGVDRLAPVDPARVYLVGHSLGAMQAARLADTAERKPAFVAALGGGGRVNRFERLLDVPFFIGVGDQDFGRGGGKQLADLLRRGGIRDVRFREYPDTEHLTIVQVALEDIFQQLDERDAALRRVSTSR